MDPKTSQKNILTVNSLWYGRLANAFILVIVFAIIQMFFNQRKTFDKIEASSSEKIRETVDKCPSGALTYFQNTLSF
jgi:hypothetical protein